MAYGRTTEPTPARELVKTRTLIRVRRIAQALDVSKESVYQMVREGQLEAVRLGPRLMRVTSESLERLLADPNLRVEADMRPIDRRAV